MWKLLEEQNPNYFKEALGADLKEREHHQRKG
jgi:hypothetical protein